MSNIRDRIPQDWPILPLAAEASPTEEAVDPATCGTCGLTWDDSISTSMTPAPSGRCPFEYFHEEPIDTRPILDLTYNGRFVIGVIELDEEGYGSRAYVLSAQDKHTANRVMLRRFDDMARLMGDNIQVRKDAFATEDEAASEADARNKEHSATWQTAYVTPATAFDDGCWVVVLEDENE